MVKVSSTYRKDYNRGSIDTEELLRNPFDVFMNWFKDAANRGIDEPNVMVLATSGLNSRPAARIVLLKEYENNSFAFFTNYQSKKGLQIAENSFGAILFPWHAIQRQVRIEGRIEKLADTQSDDYFSSRPDDSKIGAWISPQSQEIPSRIFLENQKQNFEHEHKNMPIPRPPFWGGYRLIADLYEFWQGGQGRLHDRIEYYLENDIWKFHRLAP